MQTGTLVSAAAASPFDANHASVALLKQQHHHQQQHRHSHRSNSLSSSSAVTVRRPGSLSRVRSESQSSETDAPLSRHLSREPMSQNHRRRKSVAIDLSEHHANDLSGVAAGNHSSHSTTSSVSSNKRRNRSSSGAVLSSLIGQSFSPRQKPLTAVDASPRPTSQRRHVASQSITGSPTRSRRTSKAGILPYMHANLPPLHTTPSLTDPNDTESPSTTQTIPTPSNHPSYANDSYFDGGDYEMAKTTRVTMIRNAGTPMSITNPNRVVSSQNRDMKKNAEATSPEHERRPITRGDGSGRNRRPRARERTEKDKKTMLAKALQKANTAVLLDNAQNYEGALQAYGDACDLLTNVMERTSGDDDRRKLDAIRVTYSNRMQELRQLVQETPTTTDEKNLPARPMSDDSLSLKTPNGTTVSPMERTLGDAFSVAPTARITDVPRLSYPGNERDSFFERTMQAVESSTGFQPDSSYTEPTIAGAETEPIEAADPQQPSVSLPPPEHAQYMPRPLSPRRPPPLPPGSTDGDQSWLVEVQPTTAVASGTNDATKDQVDPTSWLDTIDESGSSCSDSVHSIDDEQGMRRKHIRGASGGTDPDFDAAFDAAVEAAYNEGFEPDLEAQEKRLPASQKHGKNDSIQVPASAIDEILPGSFQARNMLPMDPDEAEEERILDDFTHDFSQNFNFDIQSKSALPRTSDSSGYSRSTWQSSQLSDRATNATSLSTVAEDGLAGRILKSAGASTTRSRGESTTALPPPTAAPTTALPLPPATNSARSSGVRSRRLSGMNPKQLKIETSPQPPEIRKRASTFHHTASPFAEEHEEKDEDRMPVPTPSDGGQHEAILQSPPILEFHVAVDETGKPIEESAVGHRPSYEAVSPNPHLARPQLFRKNKSSISLRGHTEHTLLLASPDVENGPGLFTPMSSTFMSFAAAKRAQDPLHSQRANFPAFAPASVDGQQYGGGIFLFDTSLSTPQEPMSPRSPLLSPFPASLEPCPESFLLRPFWLMRALQQTIAHPRGGYLSNKLFVPREVWQTRGVKLKLIEDKVSNCDLLTAALGRLANADTYDADAVSDELQSFEEVMERVQATLTKKLGSDVGVHGVAGIFRDASAASVASAMGNAPGSDGAHADKAAKSNSGKSYLTSWRKLRSKSSGAPLSGGSQATAGALRTPTDKEQHTMPSVPMTSFVPVERRGNKRDARNMSFEGPNQEYMGSLARLFDGVQVLDQIARQVEDPGLKHSSPTHVGLELSIRHAAEFFGFFICRFVLADLTLLMDKFVKRGTEWVLA